MRASEVLQIKRQNKSSHLHHMQGLRQLQAAGGQEQPPGLQSCLKKGCMRTHPVKTIAAHMEVERLKKERKQRIRRACASAFGPTELRRTAEAEFARLSVADQRAAATVKPSACWPNKSRSRLSRLSNQ